MLLDELAELGAVVLPGEGVGVFAVGQEADLDVHPLLQQHVDAAQGGLDAGGVAVIEDGEVVGEAVYQLDLVGGQGRARGGHHVLHAALVHGDDVRVALHQVAAVLLDDGLLGLVDAVEFVALVVDFRLGRVDVLHLDALGGGGQHAPAEGHDLAAQRVEGEDDAAPEAVAQAVVVRLVAEAGLDEEVALVALGQGFLGEGVVALGAVAQLELLDGVVAEAAAAQVGQADVAPLVRVAQGAAEVVVGKLVDDEEAVALGLCGLLLVGQFALLDFDVVLRTVARAA